MIVCIGLAERIPIVFCVLGLRRAVEWTSHGFAVTAAPRSLIGFCIAGHIAHRNGRLNRFAVTWARRSSQHISQFTTSHNHIASHHMTSEPTTSHNHIASQPHHIAFHRITSHHLTSAQMTSHPSHRVLHTATPARWKTGKTAWGVELLQKLL